MTLPEYLYRMKAYSLSRVDAEYDLHLQAWLNVQAGAKRMKGDKQVSVYKSFNDFFDYKKRVDGIHKTPKVRDYKKERFIKRVNELHKRKEENNVGNV